MTSLEKLQRSFQESLIHDDASDFKKMVVGSETVSRTRRIGIYQNAYFLRLFESIQEDFPGLEALMGIDAFEQLIKEYLLKYPSNHFSMRYLGKQLYDFLKDYETEINKHALMEMFLFEWNFLDIYDAKDEKNLKAEDLTTIPEAEWPNVCFTIQSNVRFLECTTNIPLIWEAVQQEESVPVLQVDQSMQAWILWRRDMDVLYEKLSEAEYFVLKAFQQEQNFSMVCEGLCDYMSEDDAVNFIVTLIQEWLEAHLFVCIHY